MDVEDLRERFGNLYSGLIYDAMRHDIQYAGNFVAHRAIKPLSPEVSHIFGPAFTCTGRRVSAEDSINESVRLGMFQSFTQGCIQVIDSGNDDTVAHFGDISGRIARKFGSNGAVVDGYTRDARLLNQDEFPTFCRGIQPIDAYGRWQITEYQVDISLSANEGSILVSPGDFVYGDPDGVLIIPRHLAAEVCSLAEKRFATERLIRDKIRDYSDIQLLNDEVGRW
jgi:4-hydroxy-4-methyl-2-oxoglutarate aldolase